MKGETFNILKKLEKRNHLEAHLSKPKKKVYKKVES